MCRTNCYSGYFLSLGRFFLLSPSLLLGFFFSSAHSLFSSLNGRITIDDVIRLQGFVFIIHSKKKRNTTITTNRENNPSYSSLLSLSRALTLSSRYSLKCCQKSKKTCGNCQLMSNFVFLLVRSKTNLFNKIHFFLYWRKEKTDMKREQNESVVRISRRRKKPYTRPYTKKNVREKKQTKQHTTRRKIPKKRPSSSCHFSSNDLLKTCVHVDFFFFYCFFSEREIFLFFKT